MKVFLAYFLALLLVNLPGATSALSLHAQEKGHHKTDAPAQQKTAAPEPKRAAPSFAFGLEDATPVKLKLSRELSSAREKAGDRVDFEVAEDIKVKDQVVIPKGGMAWGTIVTAQEHRRMGRAGKLDVKIEEVRLADGERIPLRADREARGSGRTGVMTGAMIASGILFFPAAPMFLFIKGKDITIPKGTAITAYTNGDTELDAQKFAKASQASDAAPVPAPTQAPSEVEGSSSKPAQPNSANP